LKRFKELKSTTPGLRLFRGSATRFEKKYYLAFIKLNGTFVWMAASCVDDRCLSWRCLDATAAWWANGVFLCDANEKCPVACNVKCVISVCHLCFSSVCFIACIAYICCWCVYLFFLMLYGLCLKCLNLICLCLMN